jgi:hypothetical protein
LIGGPGRQEKQKKTSNGSKKQSGVDNDGWWLAFGIRSAVERLAVVRPTRSWETCVHDVEANKPLNLA